MKESWPILKMEISKEKSSPACTKFKCNYAIISDKNKISVKFNKFFVNAGATLAAANAPSNENPLEYMKNDTNIIIQSSPVTEKEVENSLSNFKLSDNESGWDELRLNDMKTIKRSILSPLMYVSNFSLLTGVFLSDCNCYSYFQIRWWNRGSDYKIHTCVSLG